jgi:hypothetical protein
MFSETVFYSRQRGTHCNTFHVSDFCPGFDASIFGMSKKTKALFLGQYCLVFQLSFDPAMSPHSVTSQSHLRARGTVKSNSEMLELPIPLHLQYCAKFQE